MCLLFIDWFLFFLFLIKKNHVNYPFSTLLKITILINMISEINVM